MDDALFLGIGLLPLVVFGKEPVAGLVSGGGNSGLPLAPLDDFYVVVWAGHFAKPPVSIFGQKESRKPKKISCLTSYGKLCCSISLSLDFMDKCERCRYYRNSISRFSLAQHIVHMGITLIVPDCVVSLKY